MFCPELYWKFLDTQCDFGQFHIVRNIKHKKKITNLIIRCIYVETLYKSTHLYHVFVIL